MALDNFSLVYKTRIPPSRKRIPRFAWPHGTRAICIPSWRSRPFPYPYSERESRGSALSTDGVVIRVLFVGGFRDAERLGELLDSNGPVPFQITHVDGLDLAAERISGGEADILLLDLGPKDNQGRALVEAARAAAPDLPVVVLSDFEDETLAVESLRQGVQDFLAKGQLNRATLARSLRYAIERHRLQKSLQSLSLIDDLTGLHNRRGFLALAEQHLRVIRRKGAGLLAYLDLDDLKTISDTYGHLEGN